jgi:hypothetical protein
MTRFPSRQMADAGEVKSWRWVGLLPKYALQMYGIEPRIGK